MKLSGWTAGLRDLIDGVQDEVGMAIPALDEFRARLSEATPDAQRRKHFEDELESFLHSQPFLREAATRYQNKKASQEVEAATALLRRAQPFLPKGETMKDEMTDNENIETTPPLTFIDVWDAIASAERILPGQAAPEGGSDPRWQAIIAIEDFVQEEPDAIWAFILRWGCSADEDLRSAVATCLLEDLLEYHFNRFFSQVEEAVRSNALLADTFSKCWKLGQAKEEENAKLFGRLQAECRKADRKNS
jgi:hypothetical protein